MARFSLSKIMTTIDNAVLEDLKSFPWRTILHVANGLEDLNDAQLRFIKGLIIEKTVAHCSNQMLTYIGAVHTDFEWHNRNLLVELKSNVSSSMYYKNNGRGHEKGDIKKQFQIKLNNSNGTNTKTILTPSDVSDLLIAVYKDGAFVVDKETVIKNSVAGGDGWVLTLKHSDITPITGPINIANPTPLNFKQIIYDAVDKGITDAISSIQ